MNIIKWLFGGSKVASETVTDIRKGIDVMVFTPEEKALANREGFELWIKYQEATAPQNVARRMIALIVTALWAFLVLLTVALWPFFREYTEFVYSLLLNVVSPVFMLVMVFYFSKRIIEGFKKN